MFTESQSYYQLGKIQMLPTPDGNKVIAIIVAILLPARKNSNADLSDKSK